MEVKLLQGLWDSLLVGFQSNKEIKMRELTNSEIKEINGGGPAAVVAAFLAGAALGSL